MIAFTWMDSHANSVDQPVRSASIAINVKRVQLGSNLETLYAWSVQVMNSSKMISVYFVAMNVRNVVAGLTSASNAQLHQNYLQNSVFAKIVSTKIRAFAKLVDQPVLPASTPSNVKRAPADST